MLSDGEAPSMVFFNSLLSILLRDCRVLLTCIVLFLTNIPVGFTVTPVQDDQLRELDKIWLRGFEQNLGQYPTQFKYIAKRGDQTFLISDRGFQLTPPKNASASIRFVYGKQQDSKISYSTGSALRNRINYFRGAKSEKWTENIPLFTSVTQQNVFPGVDVNYYLNQGEIEYDYVLAPGADAELIRVKIENAESLKLAANGDLLISNKHQQFVQRAPIAFQEINGQRQIIKADYVIAQSHEISFKLASYDHSKPIVIDPLLNFSFTIGGQAKDVSRSVVIDASENIIIAGATTSSLFPADGGLTNLPNGGIHASDPAYPIDCSNLYLEEDFDIYVMKFNSAGSLLFSTFIGGCDNDGVRDLTVDASGNIYLVGSSKSRNYPFKNSLSPILNADESLYNPPPDAVITKLDGATGALVFSTYFGGSGADRARRVAVDSSNRVYILGNTQSDDIQYMKCSSFPIDADTSLQCKHRGILKSDIFLLRLSINGSIVEYASYIGGSGDDWGSGLKLIENGGNVSIVIAGTTTSPDLFVNQNANDDRYANITPSYKSFQYSNEYCKGDLGEKIARRGLCSEAFYARIDGNSAPAVNEMEFNLSNYTYLGGHADEEIANLAIDNFENVYLIGSTYSPSVELSSNTSISDSVIESYFPVYNRIVNVLGKNDGLGQTSTKDAFVTAFNPNGDQLLLSSLIRGSGHDTGTSIELIDNGGVVDIYIAGITNSLDMFPMDKGFRNLALKGDGFLGVLYRDPSASNQLKARYLTLIGGEREDSILDIAVAKQGGVAPIYVMATGETRSDYFPLLNLGGLGTSVQNQNFWNTFLLRVDDDNSSQTELSVSVTHNGGTQVFIDDKVNFTVLAHNESVVTAPDAVVAITLPAGITLGTYDIRCNIETSLANAEQTLYCPLTNFVADSIESLNFSITPRFRTTYEFDVGVFNRLDDFNLNNNSITTRLSVLQKPKSGLFDWPWLMFLLGVIFSAAYQRRRQFPTNQ